MLKQQIMILIIIIIIIIITTTILITENWLKKDKTKQRKTLTNIEKFKKIYFLNHFWLSVKFNVTSLLQNIHTLCITWNYIIRWIMLYFDWLLLMVHDLLENRRIDDLTIKKLLLCFNIKPIDFMLLWICTVIDHRWHQKMVGT